MRLIGIVLALLLQSASLSAQSALPEFPPGARILEVRPLSIVGYPQRSLVLWMLNPERHPSFFSFGEGDLYTCPEMTRGSHFRGPLRVSLVDSQNRVVINTVKVRNFWGDDFFDVPYAITKNRFYRTAAESERRESKPIVMWLRDYAGEGEPLQFALFDALACMGLRTSLIGYVPSLDRVQQYQTDLTVHYEGKTTRQTIEWVDYLFSFKPVRRGYWKYEIDYTGRGGTLDSYEIRFIRKEHRFQATLISRDPEPLR